MTFGELPWLAGDFSSRFANANFAAVFVERLAAVVRFVGERADF